MSSLSSKTTLPPTSVVLNMESTSEATSESLDNVSKKRGANEIFESSKKMKVSLREMSAMDQFKTYEKCNLLGGESFEQVQAIYDEYYHVPTGRSWSAAENRQCAEMLQKLGFSATCVELNSMLPEGIVAEEANILVWENCAEELAFNPTEMYDEQANVELDKVKWSRRSVGLDKDGKPRNGFQNKLARHNCCITDLEEPITDPDNTVIGENYVRHPHPKNSSIKYTNYGFEMFPRLKEFRWDIACILGPFGYKVVEQFFELNHYYARTCGIGRHGDVERGQGMSDGMVNCLKLGRKIPLLFSWYHKTKPIGRETVMDSNGPCSYPVVHFKRGKKWETKTVAAVMKLGHGDYYQFSGKAIGRDWKKSSQITLRHCAGASKYTSLPKSFDLPESGELPSAYSLTGSDRVENDSESPELQFATRFDGM
jgi:hypothetical protein